jgi:hypothetical protein
VHKTFELRFEVRRRFPKSTGQKQAWLSLAIATLSLVGILALTPVIGFQRAQGSLGLLGLWGLTPLLYRTQPGIVRSDERDGQIQLRSWVVAYCVFWVVFVLVCASAPLSFESTGSVPVFLIHVRPFYAMMFVLGASSIAARWQYG